ncbi:LLM class flavin-dependent oxidoreductase [Jiangella anatolica]|uniref:LLM class flavin-dependent oxidoreductase n=1 Tax=Jiangella anatolica TaxID=2670374 RepID=A0A2W2BYS7_9ACTN|nr:LLM class flavin-dependent oxidoreductase [Jiangella anatolica]PZF81209.1 LLM class flavin-dependent oxidoreductase [Jiangella anatolica]
MTDYGHDLRFGVNVLPAAGQPEAVIGLAQLAERAGADLVTFQDHPYHPGFLDTWTLLSFVAARTERVRLAGNVHPLPLRPPAVLARAAAGLDVLSGGRFELALGAGGYWDAIEAMDGPRRTPGEAVEALEEAIAIVRATWAVDEPGGVRVDGRHHRVAGTARGPRPAHAMELWLGAYGPRMLRLTGRLADGWLPSLPALKPGALATGNKIVDEAAAAAGRDPAAIRRLLNLGGELPAQVLAELALADGVSTFILMTGDPAVVRRYLDETAPRVRVLVADARRLSAGGS